MAEQFNHKYELIFGQPVSFYQGTATTAPPYLYGSSGTEVATDLTEFVGERYSSALKLEQHHIEFDIDKSKESGKESTITIYNCSDLVRYYLEAKKSEAPLVTLRAGYEDTEMNLLFQGEVYKVEEVFNGTTRQTKLLLRTAYRSMNEAFTVRSYKKGTPVSDIVRDVVSDLKLPEGTIYYKELGKIYIDKPVALSGKSYPTLKKLMEGLQHQLYFEDGTVNVVPKNYVERDGKFVFDINVNNMIGSPTVKSDTQGVQENQAANRDALTVTTVLNGAYQIGNLVNLTSKFHNGVYEIEAIKHNGSYEGSQWQSRLDIKPVDGWEVRR